MFWNTRKNKSRRTKDHSFELESMINKIKKTVLYRDASDANVYYTENGHRIVTLRNRGGYGLAFGIDGASVVLSTSKNMVEKAFDTICPNVAPDGLSTHRVLIPGSVSEESLLYKKEAGADCGNSIRGLTGREMLKAHELMSLVVKKINAADRRQI